MVVPRGTCALNPDMITVDLSTPNGQLRRRLHSSGFMPNISKQYIRDFSESFARLNFHESRTHDLAPNNPGQRMVDTHFVFPNMRTDPSDPLNYYFAATDALFENCRKCGTGILYRLGTSIEHTLDRHFNTVVPDDFDKYAEVLAGIVRHYNHGWADGFHWDIRYWEIWNEPDLGPRMWDGTMEQFHEFYVVVAKRLRAEFPEIKIGGPGFCNLKEDLFTSFLNHCRKHEAPVDFVSWHRYTEDVEGLVAQPARGRKLLDELGFPEAETMINEWHYLRSWEGVHRNVTPEAFEEALSGPAGLQGIDSAAFNVAVITGWHDTPLDSAYYYGCGEANWGFVNHYKALNKNYFSMYMIGQMMVNFPERKAATAEGDTVSVLAGSDDGGRCGLLVADYRGSDLEIPVEMYGTNGISEVEVQLLDHAEDLRTVEARVEGNLVRLQKQERGSAVFLVTFQSRS